MRGGALRIAPGKQAARRGQATGRGPRHAGAPRSRESRPRNAGATLRRDRVRRGAMAARQGHHRAGTGAGGRDEPPAGTRAWPRATPGDEPRARRAQGRERARRGHARAGGPSRGRARRARRAGAGDEGGGKRETGGSPGGRAAGTNGVEGQGQLRVAWARWRREGRVAWGEREKNVCRGRGDEQGHGVGGLQVGPTRRRRRRGNCPRAHRTVDAGEAVAGAGGLGHAATSSWAAGRECRSKRGGGQAARGPRARLGRGGEARQAGRQKEKKGKGWVWVFFPIFPF
jgi:hypothetical protein